MLLVECSGTPFEIGTQHGRAARKEIAGSISFYNGLFEKKTAMKWEEVRETALLFKENVETHWPHYLEEMQGIATGSGVDFADILAINVRTEITFGLFSDACTALSWLTNESSFLAQNWDWMEPQKANLINIHIKQHASGKPDIKMITEAGIIGKIGFNSAGVGVLLNAIKAKGMDAQKLPCHLALRMVLDSTCREDAVKELQRFGVASSCHILIADQKGGVGVECSAIDLLTLPMDQNGRVFHTNHYVLDHPGVVDTVWLRDSLDRLPRAESICNNLGQNPAFGDLMSVFRDETGYPNSICRAQSGTSETASLFNIIMDLKKKEAQVVFGRPSVGKDPVSLSFQSN